MQLFGLTFLLYFLKLSVGNGFWNNLRNTDHKVYKKAIKVERLLSKLKKYECNFWLNVEMKMCSQNLSNINTLRTNRINIDIDITDVFY